MLSPSSRPVTTHGCQSMWGKLERVLVRPPSGLERQLPVLRQAGDTDADESQGSWPVAKPAVEQPACKVSDSVGLVDGSGEGRRA